VCIGSFTLLSLLKSKCTISGDFEVPHKHNVSFGTLSLELKGKKNVHRDLKQDDYLLKQEHIKYAGIDSNYSKFVGVALHMFLAERSEVMASF